MPLLLLCGLPSSGKTKRANELKEYFEKMGKKVHVVSDDSLGIDRNTTYSSQTEEKKARGAFLSALERLINPDDVIIGDGMNYIKGFRYQIHCVVKNVPTSICLVECMTPKDTIREWNEARDDSHKYSKEILEELFMRYEAPTSAQRWEKPLFMVEWDDPLPLDEIRDALLFNKTMTPNLSIKPTPMTDTNFLFEVDKITQEIINEILAAQKSGPIGEPIKTTRSSKKVVVYRNVTLAELRRVKTQFLNLQKVNTIRDTNKTGDLFVDFLNPILNT